MYRVTRRKRPSLSFSHITLYVENKKEISQGFFVKVCEKVNVSHPKDMKVYFTFILRISKSRFCTNDKLKLQN